MLINYNRDLKDFWGTILIPVFQSDVPVKYENIKLDINYDLLEKYDTKYLKDK